MGADERRRHGRVEADLPCNLVAGEAMEDGRVLDLSKGGARVLAPADLAAVGDPVLLAMEPAAPLAPVDLQAEVVRVDLHPRGAVYALRFSEMLPDVVDAVEAILRALLEKRGQGNRAHPRVARRMNVTCRSTAEFDATLRDLSEGGLAMLSRDPVELGATIQVRLGSEEFPALLELFGEAVHVEPTDGGFRVGLRFSRLDPQAQGRIRMLIELLVGLAPRQVMFEEDDEDDPADAP
jgi:c-di-GMP-binding flagellar brake protein YcgR